MRILKYIVLALTLFSFGGLGFSQNLISNGGFEDNPPSSFGDNINHSISPWSAGSGATASVIQVDGPNGASYGNAGPESDASNNGAGAGEGVNQHYLDASNGDNEFFQTITTTSCPSSVNRVDYRIRGAWSTREGFTSSQNRIRIVEGTGTGGTTVAGSDVTFTTTSTGSSGTEGWDFVQAEFRLTPGTTYTYVFFLPNNSNFDEASLEAVSGQCTQANVGPIAQNDTVTTPFETAIDINVLDGSAGGTDSDGDGDTLTVTAFGTPANGTVADQGNGVLRYTPNTGFSGADSFTYDITDGTATASATVNVTVDARVVTSPTANDINSTGNALGSNVVIDLKSFFNTDVNNTPINQSTCSLSNNSTSGQGATLVWSGEGTWTVDGACVMTFTPENNTVINPRDIFYCAEDTEGDPANCARISISYAANQNPTAVDDNATTPFETSVAINVLDGSFSNGTADSDPNGDSLTPNATTAPSNGVLSAPVNGVITYTPTNGFVGTDSFTYVVTDGLGGTSNTATVTVIVQANNPAAPTAVNDSFNVNSAPVAGSTYTPGRATNNDSAGDSAIDQNTGRFFVNGSNTPTNTYTDARGTFLINGTADFVFTPSASFIGPSTSIDYTIADQEGDRSNVATITVTFSGTMVTNTNPTAIDDAATTPFETPVSINVLDGSYSSGVADSDPENNTLSVSLNVGPSNGAVSGPAGGVFTYTPNTGFSGSDSFTYTLSDGNGGTDIGQVNVTTQAAVINNNPPVATNNTGSTTFPTPVTVNVLGDDTDVDNDTLTIVSVTQPTNGTATFSGNNVVYTPTTNTSGNDTFTYTISDGNGGTSTANVTIAVTAAATNTPPVAEDDAVTTPFETAVSINVLDGSNSGGTADRDADNDTLSVSVNVGPSNGTLTGPTGGVFIYTPNSGFTGSDSFTYTLSDGNGGTDIGQVNVTTQATANTPPMADDETEVAVADTPVILSVLTGDTDADGDTLTITSFTQPTNNAGTVTQQGNNLIFTPTMNFSGTTGFTYTISDGNGGTDVGNVAITVAASNTILTVNKTTRTQSARPGDYVAYSLELNNNTSAAETGLDVVDVVPLGLSYIAGTAQLDGVALEPTISGQELIWSGVDFTANQSRTLSLLFVVGQNVKSGQTLSNMAYVDNGAGNIVRSNSSTVSFVVRTDEIFDCSALIGKVFNDLNQNGIQNRGERGISGARIITTRGLIITTDEYGRYHIPCAAAPREVRGSNFIVKLDKHSLPMGYNIITENPRVVRMTSGKIAEANFSISSSITLELAVEIYDNPIDVVMESTLPNIDETVQALLQQRAVLSLLIVGDDDGNAIGNAIESALQQKWQAAGAPYRLDIQRLSIQPAELE